MPTATPPLTMKAMVHRRYGAFDALSLQDLPQPAPGPDEVRIRVHAAGLHVGDCFAVRGAPFVMRLMTGLFAPRLGVPGYDVAGRVEAVGAQVSDFKVGDEVFGGCEHACAEYVCVPAKTLALKPPQLSFEAAASIPTSGLAALHALRDVAQVQAGQRVLVNGASGGVGTFAVQLAKSMGAEVTGVCSSRNVELVRALGADEVIDYTQQDFTAGPQRYDLIFDNVENRSLSDCRRVLTDRGLLIVNSGTGARGLRMLVRLFKPLLLSPFVRHRLRRYLSTPNHPDLVALAELVGAGKLRPVIDHTCTLEETPRALEYIEAGHARGKVVVRLLGADT